MVIRDLLKEAGNNLYEKGIEDSYNEALILFAYALDKSKTFIHTHMNEEIKAHEKVLFGRFIEKRSLHMPVAYIAGRAWFMSMEFIVDESTLIPRPETEELVEETMDLINNISGEEISILDLCTGSGCIGIALAHYDKRINVVLADNNPACIKIAKKNIIMHNLGNRITTVKSDLYEALPLGKYTLITANPPYIPSDDIEKLSDDVRLYEPNAALDGGADGLGFYRKIINRAPEFLKSRGYLVLEAGINQSESISHILVEKGFSDILIRNDISGIPRIITACLS